MFDRRAKIFLALLVLMTLVLLMRAIQVQVVDHVVWSREVDSVMSTGVLTETTRGKLLDRRGYTIAEDTPCIDACVDYRAITSNTDWLKSAAQARLISRMGDDFKHLEKERRQSLVTEEVLAVRKDIETMWQTLATLGGMTMSEMNDLGDSIIRKVEMRRRLVWHWRYEQALVKHRSVEPAPWYRSWLLDESQQTPELDDFDIHVGEEVQPHVILPAISNETNVFLAKNASRFPGLVLQPGVRRTYPFNDAAAHVIGRLSRISPQELSKNADVGGELKQYLRNDLIGHTGLEALCEEQLRGTRGKIERRFGDQVREISRSEPVSGQDVRTSLDIDLQADIQQLFKNVEIDDKHTMIEMLGAAVVIDIPTNEVLALVSYPSYDLNTYEEVYSQLAHDDIRRPLMNRATQFALEPGSTVKPMVGLGAITQGVLAADGTIECTGYLQLNGKTFMTEARCWTMSMYKMTHREVPTDARHPTGFLTYPEALERSCNVFFETLADRLGMDGLRTWFGRFGLGQPTGIGIAEVSGQLPGDVPIPASLRRATTWFCGIGQNKVLATPIQMANVAATIARRGIWMRPRLVPDPSQDDRVDLHLSPIALDEARRGMINVVNGPAGTGTQPHRADMTVAGKTGSAQAPALHITKRDAAGDIIYKLIKRPEYDEKGQVVFVEHRVPETYELKMSTREDPNPQALWYRGWGEKEDHRSHAWYIGFAPAENPKIAFAVMVEYGGSGNNTAGNVAKRLLEACVEHGYLARK